MNATRPSAIIAMGAIVIGVACASPAQREAETATKPARPARRSSVRITRQELMESTALDALQAVQSLRPDWLIGRGATTMTGQMPELLVYLDGQRLGPRQVLGQFSTSGIEELRYHSAPEATQRWGTGHDGGVIEIITMKR